MVLLLCISPICYDYKYCFNSACLLRPAIIYSQFYNLAYLFQYSIHDKFMLLYRCPTLCMRLILCLRLFCVCALFCVCDLFCVFCCRMFLYSLSLRCIAQVRTSYMPGEIMWGHRLAPLMTYQSDNGQHTIDYSQFHGTIPVDMPECRFVKRLSIG